VASIENLPPRKRDGKVRYRATVERARHRAPTKQKVWRPTFDTKTAAQRWARDAEHHLDRGHIPDCGCSLDGPCSGLTVQEAAELAAKRAVEEEANRSRAETTTLTAWRTRWWPVYCKARGIAAGTMAAVESRWTNHLEPRWGETTLAAFDSVDIQEWVNEDLTGWRAPATVHLIAKDLHLLLEGAVTARPPILEHNPAYRLHLPDLDGAEAIHTDPAGVAAIAQRCGIFSDLVWCLYATGWRWSELAGLRDDLVVTGRPRPRDNGPCIDRDAGVLRIHPELGCLHEVNGHLTSGPPKTKGSARTTPIPAFAFDLIDERIEMTPKNRERGPYVWLGPRGGLLRRSGFNRRYWRPACDGRPYEPPRRGTAGHPDWEPLMAGMTVHGLRHSHKALLQAEGIADSIIEARLGHVWAGEDGRSRISGLYSHTLTEVDVRIVKLLQARYEAATAA
jgi:integrase